MSERQEHKRRYNLRLEFIAKFEKWLENEPPHVSPLLALAEMARQPSNMG